VWLLKATPPLVRLCCYEYNFNVARFLIVKNSLLRNISFLNYLATLQNSLNLLVYINKIKNVMPRPIGGNVAKIFI